MKSTLISIVFLLIAASCVAQNAAILTPYFQANGLATNPAYCGSRGGLSGSIYMRRQWVKDGLQNPPSTMSFALHSPTQNAMHNFGGYATGVRLGPYTNTTVAGSYAYRFDLGRGKLALGLAGGIKSYLQGEQSPYTVDVQDQLFPTNKRVSNLPLVGFGGYFHLTNSFYLGGGSDDLWVNKPNSHVYRGYNFCAGFLLPFSNDLKLFPTVMSSFRKADAPSIYVNTSLIYKNFLWLKAACWVNRSIGGGLALDVSLNLQVSYNFEINTGPSSSLGGTSHAFLLIFDFDKLVEKALF